MNLETGRSAILITSALLLLIIWIHLAVGHASCKRYFLPTVLILSPYAAIGLLWCMARLRNLQKNRPLEKYVPWLAASPGLVVAAIGMGTALASDMSFRAAEVELGQWVKQEFGPGCNIFGPEGIAHVVNYYAEGRCLPFSPKTPNRRLLRLIAKWEPEVVLLPSDPVAEGKDSLRQGVERLGFAELDPTRFTGGCRKVSILVRQEDARRTGFPTRPAKMKDGLENPSYAVLATN